MKFQLLKEQLNQLKKQTLTVYFAVRDPRMPIFVSILAMLVAAYALSPIDLIPDFIPLIGYLDDLILIPLGLALVVHFSPTEVMESARLKTQQTVDKPVSYSAAIFVIIIWMMLLWAFVMWVLRAT